MQIVIIHGGDSFTDQEAYLKFLQNVQIDFERYKGGAGGWKSKLPETLGADFQIIAPSMPNKSDVKYEEWKIWFEKSFPYLEEKVMLLGHSLGGIFLTKYLSEHDFPKKIRALFLVAAPYEDSVKNEEGHTLLDFKLPASLDNVNKQAETIFLYYSEDDPTVPIADLEKYMKALPNAHKRIFADRKHFNQETFSEIVEDIKSLSS